MMDDKGAASFVCGQLLGLASRVRSCGTMSRGPIEPEELEEIAAILAVKFGVDHPAMEAIVRERSKLRDGFVHIVGAPIVGTAAALTQTIDPKENDDG